MNWSTLAAWLDNGTLPDIPKLTSRNIGMVYVDPTSANAAAAIAYIHANGLQAGIYEASNWFGGGTPVEFVTRVHADVKRLISQAYPLPSQAKGAPVMLDIEAEPIDWQRAVVAEYRRQMPSRETAWTDEPWKDGTVTPFPELAAAGFHFYPQLYYGDMAPVENPAAVALVPSHWGFPGERTHPFYDAARLPSRGVQDGCVFTAGRLP